jgi:hypothetical protein
LSKQKSTQIPVEQSQGPKHTASAEFILNRDVDDQSPQGKRGPKHIDINWEKVEAYMSIGMDLKSCAMAGGCHWNTLERRIQEKYGENFREVRAAFLTDRKALALKKMWDKVNQGDSDMIKFANRVFNGLNDRPKEMDDDNDEGSTFTLAYNLDEPPPIEAEFKTMEDK